MKIFLTLFVLFYSSSALSGDISDLQIEGMSVGDSLLKFYTKSQINNAPNYNHLPSDMKFTVIEMPTKGKYDKLQIYYYTNNSDYKIASVGGGIFMDINKCIKEEKQIVDDISSELNNVDVYGPIENTHQDDPSGNSYFIRYELEFDGGYAVIDCYHYSKQTGWKDHMRISIVNYDVKKWINNNYGLN